MKMNKLELMKFNMKIVKKGSLTLSDKVLKTNILYDVNGEDVTFKVKKGSSVIGNIVVSMLNHKEIKAIMRSKKSFYKHEITINNYDSAGKSGVINTIKMKWLLENLEYINGVVLSLSFVRNNPGLNTIITFDKWLSNTYSNFYRKCFKCRDIDFKAKISERVDILESYGIDRRIA